MSSSSSSSDDDQDVEQHRLHQNDSKSRNRNNLQSNHNDSPLQVKVYSHPQNPPIPVASSSNRIQQQTSAVASSSSRIRSQTAAVGSTARKRPSRKTAVSIAGNQSETVHSNQRRKLSVAPSVQNDNRNSHPAPSVNQNQPTNPAIKYHRNEAIAMARSNNHKFAVISATRDGQIGHPTVAIASSSSSLPQRTALVAAQAAARAVIEETRKLNEENGDIDNQDSSGAPGGNQNINQPRFISRNEITAEDIILSPSSSEESQDGNEDDSQNRYPHAPPAVRAYILNHGITHHERAVEISFGDNDLFVMQHFALGSEVIVDTNPTECYWFLWNDHQNALVLTQSGKKKKVDLVRLVQSPDENNGS